MSLAMNQSERDQFLSEVRVGVIAIEQKDAAPLTIPIWYDYSPDIGVWVLSRAESSKSRCLYTVGRFSLSVQDDTPPLYRYVSVSGAIIETRDADIERDMRPMARRYFGIDDGDAFTAASAEHPNTVFVMRPEKWRTVDYGKS